jgi:hypothetical protein
VEARISGKAPTDRPKRKRGGRASVATCFIASSSSSISLRCLASPRRGRSASVRRALRGQDTDKDTASRTQAVQLSLVSGVSRRVRVPSTPPIHVNPCSPSEMVRRGFRPFSAVFSATLGFRPAVLMDERPWTWVHGQNTDKDTSSLPGLGRRLTGRVTAPAAGAPEIAERPSSEREGCDVPRRSRPLRVCLLTPATPVRPDDNGNAGLSARSSAGGETGAHLDSPPAAEKSR